jgi:hypothetical protein
MGAIEVASKRLKSWLSIGYRVLAQVPIIVFIGTSIWGSSQIAIAMELLEYGLVLDNKVFLLFIIRQLLLIHQ